jgi:group I intron endonuclease
MNMINIYAYQNKINGKVYIGQTDQTLVRRSGTNGSRYKGCKNFLKAIQKYGLNNFDRWIFNITYTIEEADQEEIYWIAEMRKQLGKNMVYNLTDGGDGFKSGHKHSEISKKKMSESGKLKIMTPEHLLNLSKASKGKAKSKEHAINISKGLKAAGIRPPSTAGQPKSEDHKRKLSEVNKGKILTEDTKKKISESIKKKWGKNNV